jgi:DNA-directed RNA polymerase alpha subunit
MSDSVQPTIFSREDLVQHPWLTARVADLVSVHIKGNRLQKRILLMLKREGINHLAEMICASKRSWSKKINFGKLSLESLENLILAPCELAFGSKFEGFEVVGQFIPKFTPSYGLVE